MDDMDFFEMVNHFFNREREVIQNPQAPSPVTVPHGDPFFLSKFENIVRRGRGGCPFTFWKYQKDTPVS